MTPEDVVRSRNSEFYAAFEARDLDAMAEVWEHSDRATVTHPGWSTLRGWEHVIGSWEAIFANTPFIQFVLTEEAVHIVGNVAWVTLDENILQTAASPPESMEGAGVDSPELAGASVAATNVYVLSGGAWRMVVHHGSPVAPQEPV